ncbi:P-loop ATPase, Sll1717 family [Streptomyces sp. NPDC030920]|uniref:P-loop ATPase, Sll1717 family n=1 Tax=Streptomyces sp. NPDC030920 TaxID=3365308 RepID=UPI00384D205F
MVAIKETVLKELTFGARVAEEEASELASYFVETEQWNQVWQDEVDIVYGPKGSGKSAIYATLTARESQLFDRNILISPAESPQGSPAFATLDANTLIDEDQFVGLWKLYFLAVIADTFADYDLRSPAAKSVVRTLTDAGMVPGRDVSLRRKLANAAAYVRRMFSEIEPSLSVAGVVDVGTRIRFTEPDDVQRSNGAVHVDDLLDTAGEALEDEGLKLWLLLDRLDVAFAGKPNLEQQALRALFKVYLDIGSIDRIRLKIFLRSDIWKAITAGGFREASHITRELTLSWGRAALLQLVTQRMVRNKALRDFYSVPYEGIASVAGQEDLFQKVYPEQVENGPNKPKTFDWCLTRTSDGTKRTAPRELIHLLTEARGVQLRRQEVGEDEPAGEALFDGSSLKGALPAVSETRLNKTLYAEHPDLKQYMLALEGHKTNHGVQSLAAIWELPPDEAKMAALRLVDIGFFEKRTQMQFWVPFLYRPALNLVQGSAEGINSSGDTPPALTGEDSPATDIRGSQRP